MSRSRTLFSTAAKGERNRSKRAYIFDHSRETDAVEPAGIPKLASLKPPLEEVRKVTGFAIAATLTDDEWGRCPLQLHTRETLPQTARYGQHVIRTILTDREAPVLAEVPADLVGLYGLAGVQRCPQRSGRDALRLGRGYELVYELLSLA